MKTLGSQKKQPPEFSKNSSTAWKMEEMGNAFRFYVEDKNELELLIEKDELAAVGVAYEKRQPLSILDIMNRLEELSPKFAVIEISEEISLIRKRLALSRGLVMRREDSSNFFMKDETLDTINFLDFYEEYLKPNTEVENEHNEQTDSSVFSLHSRAKNTGT